jgi:HlyD family secretion protein
LTFSWFIKYPDVIKGTLKLSAINPPKLLISKAEGKLQRLLVSNDQEVKKGQALSYIQATANHQQVLELQKKISLIIPAIFSGNLEVIQTNPFPIYSELGELQSAYQDFQNVFKETLQIIGNGYYQKKKYALQLDLQLLDSVHSNTLQQQYLTNQDYELQQKEYVANESLAKQKVIAPVDLNQNKSKVIGKEQGLAQISAQLINNKISEQNKRKEILDLQKTILDQRQKFSSALFTLKSKIEDWVQKYVVVAPEDGKILFTSFLQENQLVANGQELYYVQPTQTEYYGQMLAAQAGLGKLKAGQKVLIRVESYPSAEFGYLRGTIAHISSIPTARDSFLIKVKLPFGLKSNYNKIIFFRNNLDAQGEVMTDDRRLLERFLGQLRDLMKH